MDDLLQRDVAFLVLRRHRSTVKATAAFIGSKVTAGAAFTIGRVKKKAEMEGRASQSAVAPELTNAFIKIPTAWPDRNV